MKDNELDNLFRSQVEHAEELPSLEVWDHIAQGLSRQERRRAGKSVIKKITYFTGIAAAVTIVGIFTFWHIQARRHPQDRALVLKAVTPAPEKKVLSTESIAHMEHKKVEVRSSEPVDLPLAQVVTKTDPSHRAKREKIGTDVREDIISDQALISEVKTKLLKTDSLQYNITLPQLQASLEAPPLKPLVENPEEEETMVAQRDSPARKSISVGGILNSLIGKVDKSDGRTLEFHTDEEGSISLQYIAKNRKKNK